MHVPISEANSARRLAPRLLSHPLYPWPLASTGVAAAVALATGITLAHRPANPSPALHAWTGLLAAFGALVHLLAHRRWLATAACALLGKARAPDGWILIALLTLASLILAVSGLALDGLGNQVAPRGTGWRLLHDVSSKPAAALAIWHVVRHRRWFAGRLRRRLWPGAS